MDWNKMMRKLKIERAIRRREVLTAANSPTIPTKHQRILIPSKMRENVFKKGRRTAMTTSPFHSEERRDESPPLPGFGSIERRFDNKGELLSVFNRSPAPGTYSPRRDFDEVESSPHERMLMNAHPNL
jgi:hypothetical protein